MSAFNPKRTSAEGLPQSAGYRPTESLALSEVFRSKPCDPDRKRIAACFRGRMAGIWTQVTFSPGSISPAFEGCPDLGGGDLPESLQLRNSDLFIQRFRTGLCRRSSHPPQRSDQLRPDRGGVWTLCRAAPADDGEQICRTADRPTARLVLR